MYRSLYIFLIAMLAAWAVSCDKSAKGHSDDDVGVDSTVFHSPDLTYAGLSDSVRDVLVKHFSANLENDSIIVDPGGAQFVITQTFDSVGRLTGYATRVYTSEFISGQSFNDFKFVYDSIGNIIDAKPSTDQFEMKRNDAGYITEFTYNNPEDPSVSYKKILTWNDKNQLVALNYTGEGEVSEEDYAYNERNLLSKLISIVTFGDVKEESEKTYRYTRFDSRGNWTRREIVTTVVSTEVGSEPITTTNYEIETRSIKYYK